MDLMDIVTARPLRLTGNPGGVITIEMNRRMTVPKWLGIEMIDRGMAEEIKPDVVEQIEKSEKKKKGK